MSDPWSSPDVRARATGTAFAPQPLPEPSPPLRQDVWAGLLTVVVTVLAGAPVGLLWARLAPQVLIVVRGEDVQVLDTFGDGFIAVDGYFLAAVLVAGAVSGLFAQRLASAHGPAVVLGLAVGGLAAAWVAMAVGEMVGADEVRALVAAEGEGSAELAVRLRATPALAGWPVAALLAYLVLAVRDAPRSSSSTGPSSSGPRPSWG